MLFLRRNLCCDLAIFDSDDNSIEFDVSLTELYDYITTTGKLSRVGDCGRGTNLEYYTHEKLYGEIVFLNQRGKITLHGFSNRVDMLQFDDSGYYFRIGESVFCLDPMQSRRGFYLELQRYNKSDMERLYHPDGRILCLHVGYAPYPIYISNTGRLRVYNNQFIHDEKNYFIEYLKKFHCSKFFMDMIPFEIRKEVLLNL